MALTANAPRTYTRQAQFAARNSLPVQASSTIYVGAALSIDANGEVGPLSASDAGFVGFSTQYVDNSSGSAGADEVEVLIEGEVVLPVTGIDDNNDIGDIVYASDDGTFTLTSTGNVAIGKLAQIESLVAATGVVRFKSSILEHHLD